MFNLFRKKKPPRTLCMLRPTYHCSKALIPNLLQNQLPNDELYSIWNNSFYPNNVIEFVTNIAYKNHKARRKDKADNIKIVTLEDSFYDWLQTKDLTESMNACAEYGAQFSDEDLLSLMKKTKMDVSYSVSALEIAFVFPKEIGEGMLHYSLSENVCSTIKEYLQSVFTDSNEIFVPGILMNTEEFRQEEDKLINLAKTYVETGQAGKYFEFERQIVPDSSSKSIVLCIPYVVYEKHTSAIFDLKSFFVREDETLVKKEYARIGVS